MTPTGVLAIVLLLLIVQRMLELRIARRNEAWARAEGAIELGARHYPLFFVLHGSWLLGWVAEAVLRGPQLHGTAPVWIGLFCAASGLRYWAITSLGPRWNTRILVLPGAPKIRRGPYRFLAHPNYVAVVVELWAVPAIFGAWVTAAVVGVLNLALLLAVRIPAESAALARAAGDDLDLRR